MKLTRIAMAAVILAGSATMFAQNSTTPTTTPNTPAVTGGTINDRKVDQQERIGQGVESGQLTAGETGRLEHQEAGINAEEHGMRAQDNGHLTAQDRHTINHQQNVESKRIYRDKHNNKVR